MAVDELIFDPDTATLERWSDLEVLRLAIIERASVCGQGVGDLDREPIRSSCCRAKAMRDIASVLVSLAPRFLDRWTPPLSNVKPLSALVLAKEYALAHPSDHATFDPEIIAIYREFLRSAAWWIRRMRYVLLDDYCTCRTGTASYTDAGPTDRDDIAIIWRTSRSALDRQAISRTASWSASRDSTSHAASSVSDVVAWNPAAIACNATPSAMHAAARTVQIRVSIGFWQVEYRDCMSVESDLLETYTRVGSRRDTATLKQTIKATFGSIPETMYSMTASAAADESHITPEGTMTATARKCLVTEEGATFAVDEIYDGTWPWGSGGSLSSYSRKIYDLESALEDPQGTIIQAHASASLLPDGYPFPSVGISSKSDYYSADVSYFGTLHVIGDYGPFYPHLPTET